MSPENNQPIPWCPPVDVADAPEAGGGGYRYDAEGFYTGEYPVQLLACEPHAREGETNANSIRVTYGAEAPNGEAVRWDQYLGLDFSKDFNRSAHKTFFNGFAPGYLGSEAHRAGTPCDLAQLPGRWALALVKKELDQGYEGRPPRNRPRVVRFISALRGPASVDLAKVKPATVAIEQVGGAPRAPAPGARPAPARPVTGAPPAASAPPAAAGVPARPAPPARPAAQPQLYPPPRPTSPEDSDLPY